MNDIEMKYGLKQISIIYFKLLLFIAGFVKACKELAVHQSLVSDKKPELYDQEESDHELIVELEDDSPQVTSTSVLPGKKSPSTKVLVHLIIIFLSQSCK